jgi:hypothetical protein
MRRNPAGQLVNMYDLTPAREYGNIEILLPSGPVLLSTDHAIRELRSRLGSFDKTDKLLCLGDPVAIAAASAIVADITGGIVPLLVWDRDVRKYLAITVDIHAGRTWTSSTS